MWVELDKRKPVCFKPVDVKVTFPDGTKQEIKNCNCEDGKDWLDLNTDQYLDEVLPAHAVTHWRPAK